MIEKCSKTQAENLSELNLSIHKEADEILHRKGLLEVLKQFGTPHISGSYALDLMTWRDLVIYLENDHISESTFFELGRQIEKLLHPLKMSYRNERLARSKGLPNGLYWGIYLGDERKGAWKIDIWAVEPPELQDLLNYCSDLKTKLTPETRNKILEIKSQCWKNPEYRRSFQSTDIYKAV